MTIVWIIMAKVNVWAFMAAFEDSNNVSFFNKLLQFF